MNTWIWESERLFVINKDLQGLIDTKVVKTVISMSLTGVVDPKSSTPLYTAILIYK